MPCLTNDEALLSVDKGAVLLTGSVALTQHLTNSFNKMKRDTGCVSWASPNITQYDIWLGEFYSEAMCEGLHDKPLAPDSVLLQAWEDIVSQDETVLLLDNKGAARLAMSAWRTARLWDTGSVEFESTYLSDDQQTFMMWSERFDEWLNRHGYADSAMLPSIIKNMTLSESIVRERMPHHIVLDGILDMPASLIALIETLSGLGVRIDNIKCSNKSVVKFKTYETNIDEVVGTAEQMKETLDQFPDTSLSLIVGDLASQEVTVRRVMDSVFYPGMNPSEISLSKRMYKIQHNRPVSEISVIHSAMRLIRLGIGESSAGDTSRLLLSPYWADGNTEMPEREKVDNLLRIRGIEAKNIPHLMEVCGSGSALYNALDGVRNIDLASDRTATEWRDSFNLCLSVLGWPGDTILERHEPEIIDLFKDCIDELASMDNECLLSANKAYSMMESILSTVRIPEDVGRAPIHIVSRADSYGLSFDCVWAVGMDSDSWPDKESLNPLLPVTMQKELNMPGSSSEHRQRKADRIFNSWINRSNLLIVSHAKTRDGIEARGANLEAVCQSDKLVGNVGKTWDIVDSYTPTDRASLQIAMSATLEEFEDFVGPEVEMGQKVAGGAYLFENQSACPFRAFIRHRLDIRPMEEIGIGLDARKRGTLLHRALEFFWTDVRTHERLCEMDADALNGCINVAITTACYACNVPEELVRIESKRLCILLGEWISECEINRPTFTVVELEGRRTINLGGIEVDVVVDRVDEISGVRVALDYKSGMNNSIASWSDERIAKPQLPAYVLTDDLIEGAVYAQPSINQCKYIGVAQSDDLMPGVSSGIGRSVGGADNASPITEWKDWKSHWAKSLDQIVAEIKSGKAHINPAKGACEHCDFSTICRQKIT